MQPDYSYACLWPGPSSTPWLHTDAFFPPCTRLLSTQRIWNLKDLIKDTLWIKKLRLTSQWVTGRHGYLGIQIDCRESFSSWQHRCHSNAGWSDILSNRSQLSIPALPAFLEAELCNLISKTPLTTSRTTRAAQAHRLECLLHRYTWCVPDTPVQHALQMRGHGKHTWPQDTEQGTESCWTCSPNTFRSWGHKHESSEGLWCSKTTKIHVAVSHTYLFHYHSSGLKQYLIKSIWSCVLETTRRCIKDITWSFYSTQQWSSSLLHY